MNDDIYPVQKYKFDTDKLISALNDVRKIIDFNAERNQINLSMEKSGTDPNEGEEKRGIYLTPDQYGAEIPVGDEIPEKLYTEFIPHFKNTYFHEVWQTLRQDYNIGRFRLLRIMPRTCLSWHRDPEPRLHLPIITHPGCLMIIDSYVCHMPADGRVWFTNTMKYHNALNGSTGTAATERIHLVAGILNS
jgi:hypothetical protein